MKKIFLVIVSISFVLIPEMVPAIEPNLNDYRLVGTISGNFKYNAAIIYEPGNKNLIIIEQGERLLGYELIKVEREEVLFKNADILFKMRLRGSGNYKSIYTTKDISRTDQPLKQEPIEEDSKNVTTEESHQIEEPINKASFEDLNFDEEMSEDIQVEQIDDNNYILKSPDKGKLFDNIYPSSFPPIAHFEKLDWISGYQIDEVDQRSIFYQTGFEEGDLIVSVNGHKWDKPGREDDVQLLFQGEKSLGVKVYRNGEILTFNYRLE